MGTADETAKQSKLSTMQSTQKRKPGSKPNGGFLSFRGKKPNTTGGDLRSSKSKSRVSSLNSKGPLSGKNKKKDNSGRARKKPSPMKCFASGEIVEGVNQYKVTSQLRKSSKLLDYDVYLVKDTESGDDYRMKVARKDPQILKTEAALLRRLEKIPGDKCFISMIEYGSIVKDKVEFLIVSPYGATLNEIMKKATMGQLSMDCSFVVGLQMLRAIQNLHSIGYIHRNISPASFHCGLGMDEPTLFLQDFRQARKFEENKKHVTARTNVKMYGCGRFANRACQGSKDQGRKDDLESWVYTLFYLMDNGSLSWKRENNSLVVIQQKDAFMAGNGKDQFTHAPRDLVPLLSVINGYEFSSAPDYEVFRNCLEGIQTVQNLNKKSCDWLGKAGVDELAGDTVRSFDCKVTGERDFLPRGEKPKKPARKKLSSGDVILGVGATDGWKVVNLLGSGGFGDVYKVHRESQASNKCYALKTESEEGEKRYLRLKVEVTVMMKTAEKKKDNKFKNFIEFVDRGKCEQLKCKFVVMGLVGPSLEDIRRKYLLASFSKHTSFNVAIQTVTALRDLHSLGYLHRDIKPANYAVGLDEREDTVYMLDFGIAKLYVDENGVHKIKRKKVKFLGTLRYACRACMMQQEQGRKDDLETWIYLVFDLMDEAHGMPWRALCDPREILKSKNTFFATFDNFQFSNILKRLKDLVVYVDDMQYDTTPDYSYILNFLKTTANDVGAKITKKLDWMGKLKQKEFDSESEKSEKKGTGDDEE